MPRAIDHPRNIVTERVRLLGRQVTLTVNSVPATLPSERKGAEHLVANDSAAVFIHGYTGSKEDFSPVLPLLAAAGITAVAYDQRGQYQSLSRGPFSLDDFAADAMLSRRWWPPRAMSHGTRSNHPGTGGGFTSSVTASVDWSPPGRRPQRPSFSPR